MRQSFVVHNIFRRYCETRSEKYKRKRTRPGRATRTTAVNERNGKQTRFRENRGKNTNFSLPGKSSDREHVFWFTVNIELIRYEYVIMYETLPRDN